jgi:cell division protein FtsW (lipid II flippase)
MEHSILADTSSFIWLVANGSLWAFMALVVILIAGILYLAYGPGVTYPKRNASNYYDQRPVGWWEEEDDI